MAQTSSVTREPSMEEILASIRRIIEDSDVTKQVSSGLMASSPAVPASETPSVTISPVNASSVTATPEHKRGEVAQFRRPAAYESEQNGIVSDSTPEQPLNLQTALRGSLDDVSSNSSARVEAAVNRAAIHEANVAEIRSASVNPPVPPVVAVSTEFLAPSTPKASEALLLQVAEKQAVSLTPETAKQEDAPVANTVSSNFSDKPLISQAAEQKVSASFGSLSQVLLEEQKRLLNEKMEAMLRPMLQEWLDTNLPPLVERLVREEIERVVRRG